MNNLLEMDDREIKYVRWVDGTYEGEKSDGSHLYLKVEKRNGEMAVVSDVYVVRLTAGGKEAQRWNFRNLLMVEWVEEK